MSITAIPQYNDDVATFDGQAIFGKPSAVAVTELGPSTLGSAAAIDIFLGRTIGTTLYGAGGGALWGLTGQLVGSSIAAVESLEAAILAFAGVVAVLGVPTNQTFPSDFQYLPNCYFVATDFVPTPGGTVAIGGGIYSLSYSMVFRQGSV